MGRSGGLQALAFSRNRELPVDMNLQGMAADFPSQGSAKEPFRVYGARRCGKLHGKNAQP